MSRRSLQLALVLSAGLLLGQTGCPRKSPPKGQTKGARPASQPDETCATDADCVLTVRRLKECCLGCTFPYAVHRSRAAAIERWHDQHCKDGTVSCPKIMCTQPKGELRARCQKRRCVTEVQFKPALARPKP
jgi:hypothetical protein